MKITAEELRNAVNKFREAAEGDSGDAEHDAACELAACVEQLLDESY
jgi:hypothetical protein